MRPLAAVCQSNTFPRIVYNCYCHHACWTCWYMLHHLPPPCEQARSSYETVTAISP